MGHAKGPDKVKLIVSLISKDTAIFPQARKLLENKYGTITFESRTLDFNHTEYYEKEMGANLKRIFYAFDGLFSPKNLYEAKVVSNSLEERFSANGKRTVNIDPGYISLSKLVLFSTKDFTHRIYLGDGIYGEITLYYKNNTFNAWPWTYPDYKTPEYIEMFNKIRATIGA